MKRLRLRYILLALNLLLIGFYALSWVRDPYLLLRPKNQEATHAENDYTASTVNTRKKLGDYMQ